MPLKMNDRMTNGTARQITAKNEVKNILPVESFLVPRHTIRARPANAKMKKMTMPYSMRGMRIISHISRVKLDST